MKCPNCGSRDLEILKSETEIKKHKEIKRALFRCRKCDTVFRDVLGREIPIKINVIVSKYEKSWKEKIFVLPSKKFSVGDIIQTESGASKITSIEKSDGTRVKKCKAQDIDTLWTVTLEKPARIGLSIGFGGEILSKKLEVDRNLTFGIGDTIKIGKHVVKIRAIRTKKKTIRTGSDKAKNIKRLYTVPLKPDAPYKYDLTSLVIS